MLRPRPSFASVVFLAATAALATASCAPEEGLSGGAGGGGAAGGGSDASPDTVADAADADASADAGDADAPPPSDANDADVADEGDAAIEGDGDAADADAGCQDPSACPVGTNPCAPASCTAGVCGFAPLPQGTALAAQVAGDCKRAVCDGAGAITAEDDLADVLDDGQACTDDVCAAGLPAHPATASGAACAEAGGKVCNGSGQCVECTGATGCASGVCDGGVCRPAACTDHVKNGKETDVDCGGSCAPCALGQGCALPGDCVLPYCSGGVCEEACGAVCGAACKATCGDSACDPAESCLDCPVDCACTPGCGDGVLDPGEACDDANRDDADFCSNTCVRQDLKVNVGNAATTIMGRLQSLGDGTLGALWSQKIGASLDVRYRRFTEAGSPLDSSDSTANSATTGDQTSVALINAQDGSFDIVWVSESPYRAVYARRFLNACVVTATNPNDTSFFPGVTFAPSAVGAVHATQLADGTLVVAWTSASISSSDSDGSAAYFQRFKPTGGVLDAFAIQANSTEPGDQIVRDVVALDNGGFAIAWEDTVADGDGKSVRARVFQATGVPLAPDFEVSTETSGDQSDAVLAATPGGFVAAFASAPALTGSRDVWMRRFDVTGAPLDVAEAPVNTTTDGYQVPTSVAVNFNGDILVVWSDGVGCETACTDDDVRGRLFGLDGAALWAADDIVSGTSAGFQGFARARAVSSGDYVVAYSGGAGPTNATTSVFMHQVPRF